MSGQIMDATLVAAPRQRNTEDEMARIKGMSRSLLNFVERRCRVERYAALDAGAMNFSAFWR